MAQTASKPLRSDKSSPAPSSRARYSQRVLLDDGSDTANQGRPDCISWHLHI